MKIAKKITISSINNIRGGFKEVIKRERVATILGVVRSAKTKISDTMGASTCFLGEFKGTNKKGEESVAPLCYLPEPMQSILLSQLQDAPETSGVEFAVNFYVTPDDSAILKYTIDSESLIEYTQSDSLKSLTAKVKNQKIMEHKK